VKKGFTLMELIIVVIIIGILAMIGLPQFFNVAERGRSAEAANLLGAIRSAQLRYYAEFSVVDTSGNCSKLDVEIGTTKYFNAPDCTGATPAGLLGTMVSKEGGYSMKTNNTAKALCCVAGTKACPKGYEACN